MGYVIQNKYLPPQRDKTVVTMFLWAGLTVTVNGTLTAVYGLLSVVRRFEPTVGTVSLYPTSAFAYKLPEI